MKTVAKMRMDESFTDEKSEVTTSENILKDNKNE